MSRAASAALAAARDPRLRREQIRGRRRWLPGGQARRAGRVVANSSQALTAAGRPRGRDPARAGRAPRVERRSAGAARRRAAARLGASAAVSSASPGAAPGARARGALERRRERGGLAQLLFAAGASSSVSCRHRDPIRGGGSAVACCQRSRNARNARSSSTSNVASLTSSSAAHRRAAGPRGTAASARAGSAGSAPPSPARRRPAGGAVARVVAGARRRGVEQRRGQQREAAQGLPGARALALDVAGLVRGDGRQPRPDAAAAILVLVSASPA